jgi:REP element-mobilizing transposase RayT
VHTTVANGDEHMPQSLVKIIVHIVFSTKERGPLITPEIEPRLYGYISGIITNNNGRMIAAGGMANHIHILGSTGRIDIGELVGDIKRDSSVWIKEQGPQFAKFYWQRGYGAFSVSQSSVASVSSYINTQKEHHKRQTWEDEFRELCRKYEVEFDERYCWD